MSLKRSEKSMPEIRACLLDMGNVLVDFCHERMLRQMAVVCGGTAAELRELLFTSGRLLDYEKGLIGEQDIRTLLEDHYQRELPEEALRLAAADIFAEKPDMIPLLQELKRLGLRLILLSNTSRIHFEFIRQRFTILDYLDAYVLSYEVQALKPEPAIFQAAIATSGLPPEQCFFTDDIADYITAARQHGLQAEQFQNPNQLAQALWKHNIPLPSHLHTE